jgi:hypothetical protein
VGEKSAGEGGEKYQTGGVGQVVPLSVPSEEDLVALPCVSCPMSCRCSLETAFGVHCDVVFGGD